MIEIKESWTKTHYFTLIQTGEPREDYMHHWEQIVAQLMGWA